MLETNMIELIIFSILSLFLLGGSLAMILNKQTIFSAFGFLVAMIALAGIFAMLDNRFLALAQIMVSVGAVVIVSTLTILTINMRAKNLPQENNKFLWFFFSAILVAPFTYLLYKSLSIYSFTFSSSEVFTSKVIGSALFSSWVLPFEIISILLLTAMLGAIVIARKDKKESK